MTINSEYLSVKEIVDIVWKEIGLPDTKEKERKMANRIHELMILRELLI